MAIKKFEHQDNQIIVHTNGDVCTSKRQLLNSEAFDNVVEMFIENLRLQDSPLLESIGFELERKTEVSRLINILRATCEVPLEQVARVCSNAACFLEQPERNALHLFVETLYDFWRSFDRFMILHSEPGSDGLDQRPYRAFNDTIESLSHLVRSIYRDLCENITGDHPRIYRQVAAGCNVGLIAVSKRNKAPIEYQKLLKDIPFIRQVWIDPPLILDPPMNKRTGQFHKGNRNPLSGLTLEKEAWLCYPAVVGALTIFVYFHKHFMGLGCALANLFELATDEQIAVGPDAVYFFGVPPERLEGFHNCSAIFYDDEKNSLVVATVPLEDSFGYFGYLKKMTLTLHNVIMMKRGRLPYHGAMVRILLKNGRAANILLIGDTAAGKSESLEAFRLLGKDCIREMRVIADDMGSLEVAADGRVLAYGTETGAFIRLDDLQQGYAFGQIDRAIIMNPSKVNARVVVPVTTIEEVLHGYPVDFLLYANNYEEIDEDNPIVERFNSGSYALEIFRDGAVMAKGTTTSTGLVHSYFANIFGPPKYKTVHEKLAKNVFKAAFESGVFIGELRTRLGIPGYQTKGPAAAAAALLALIGKEKR